MGSKNIRADSAFPDLVTKSNPNPDLTLTLALPRLCRTLEHPSDKNRLTTSTHFQEGGRGTSGTTAMPDSEYMYG